MKMNYRQRHRVKRFVFHLTINQISPVDQVNVEMYHSEKKEKFNRSPLRLFVTRHEHFYDFIQFIFHFNNHSEFNENVGHLDKSWEKQSIACLICQVTKQEEKIANQRDRDQLMSMTFAQRSLSF